MLAQTWPDTKFPPTDDSIMELSLMMSRQQFEALEQRAHEERLTVAQFLRRMVQRSIEETCPVGAAN